MHLNRETDSWNDEKRNPGTTEFVRVFGENISPAGSIFVDVPDGGDCPSRPGRP